MYPFAKPGTVCQGKPDNKPCPREIEADKIRYCRTKGLPPPFFCTLCAMEKRNNLQAK